MNLIFSLAFTLPATLLVWGLCYLALLRRKHLRTAPALIAGNLAIMWMGLTALHQVATEEDVLLLSWPIGATLCLVTRLWGAKRVIDAEPT